MHPDDPYAVAADDHLVDDLAAGSAPPTRDQVAVALGAWRDSVRFDPEPIYSEVLERYLAAPPRSRTPVLDAQSLAYRGMTAADAVPDDAIPALVARAHGPLDPSTPLRGQLLLPDDWERDGWDHNRIDPRPGD